MLLSIIFFLLLLFFLGFSLFYLSKIHISYDWFIRIILYLGAGLGTFVFLIVVFDVVGIPLDYGIFGFVSLLCPLHYFITKGKNKISSFLFPSLLSKNYFYYGIVLAAAILLFITYYQGAFAYPYLEDDDPWEHAVAVKYIAEEKTYYQSSGESISHYLEPYPPTYDAILALMYQINGSVFLTLKVFNVLLITLGILFFFIFVSELFDLQVATAAAVLLVALPSSMSHFIWSHTLGLVLFFPAFFAAYKAFSEKQWRILAVVLIAAEMVVHPFVSVLFGVFFILFLLVFLFQKDYVSFKSGFVLGLFGVLLSFLYWGQQLLRHGLENILYSHTGGFGGVASSGLETAADLYINPAYTLSDLLIAPLVTKIDQPTGFGVLAFVLALLGFFYLCVYYKEKNYLVVALWFVATFIGLMGGHFPFSILTHRFWAYASIPFAIAAGIFVTFVLKKVWDHKLLFVCVSLFFFFGIFGVPSFDAFNVYTSWSPKYAVETDQWPPGVAWSSVQELEGYMWMHDNLSGSRVLSLCKEEKFLIGFDIVTDFPNDEMNAFRKNVALKSTEDIILQSVGYDALSLEYSCVKKGYLTEDQLNTFANALASEFSVLFMNDEIIVYALD